MYLHTQAQKQRISQKWNVACTHWMSSYYSGVSVSAHIRKARQEQEDEDEPSVGHALTPAAAAFLSDLRGEQQSAPKGNPLLARDPRLSTVKHSAESASTAVPKRAASNDASQPPVPSKSMPPVLSQQGEAKACAALSERAQKNFLSKAERRRAKRQRKAEREAEESPGASSRSGLGNMEATGPKKKKKKRE